jgi:nitrite reductase/ring-hydroxylating ferredoxin subunit
MDDENFAADGLCTHEEGHLAEGFVEGDLGECPNTAAPSTMRLAKSRDRLPASI